MASFPGPDKTLMALLASSTEALRLDPHNETIRTGIFSNQVKLTAGQLGITQTQAANTVRSYTAAYAYSKGYDPKDVLDGLNSAQQQILNYDKNKPTLYGMDLVTANRIASYFAASAGVVLALSIVAFAVALFMIGPEAAAAVAAAGGVVEAITAITGVAVGSTGGGALAIGSFLFLVSQFLGHMGSSIPMWTKQMVDNGTIAASLQITAIKNVAEVQAQLSGTNNAGPYDSGQFNALYNGLSAAGFTQIKNPVTGDLAPFSKTTLAQLVNYLYGSQVGNGQSATPTKITPLINPWLYKGGSNNPIPLSLYDQVVNSPAPAVSSSQPTSSSNSSNSTSAAQTAPKTTVSTSGLQIYTGVISGGTLGLPQEFTATPASLIANMTDLVHSAQVNLAAAVQSLPGRFFYEIAIVNTIKTKSGFTQKGQAVQIITGYYKNGSPKTKTVYMKFAQMKLSVTDENGKIVKLATINLGPVDVTTFSPSQTQLTTAQDTIKSSSFTTDITNVQQVVSTSSPTVVSNPTQISAPTATTTPSTPSSAQSIPTPNGTVVPIPVTIYLPAGGAFRAVGSIGDMMYKTLPNGGYSFINLLDPSLGLIVPGTVGAGVQVGQALAQLKQRYNFEWNSLPQINMGDYLSQLSRIPGTGYQSPEGSFILNPAYSIRSTNIMDFINAQHATLTPQEINNNVSAKVVTNAAASAAATLNDYFAAIGVSVPSLNDRAATYESAGLGPASTYVGSADQNNKLLGWLKSH